MARNITPLDLSLDQFTQVEREIGVPATRWKSGDIKSLGELLRAIRIAAGEDPAVTGALSMREVIASTSLDEPDDTTPDPTADSASS